VSYRDLERLGSVVCLFVCPIVRIVLNIANNLLRPHALKGRGPAERRNMGGFSRAVLVLSNPKTRPLFLRSFPTVVPAPQHSDDADLSTLCPFCRTAPAVRETPPRGRPLLASDRLESSPFSPGKGGACRRTTSGGESFLADGMARRRRESRRTVLPRDGEAPWLLRSGSRKVSQREEPGRRR
jgi:hypothetical protein